MKVKRFFLLNVFLALTIFARGQEKLPFVIESTGAVELSQMKITNTQSVLLAGTFTHTLSYSGQSLVSAGEEDVFLIHVNAEGDLLWMTSFGGIFDDDVSVLTLQGESIWIAGGFRDRAHFDTLTLNAPDGGRSLFLVQLAYNGGIQLHKQLDGPGLKSITSIGTEQEGVLYLGGYFRRQLAFDNTSIEAKGITDLFVLELNNNDDLNVIYQAGERGNTRIEQLVVDARQQIIIGGTFDDQLILGADTLRANTLDKDVFMASLDKDGQVRWSLKAGGVFDKELVRLSVDAVGNIYGGGQLVGVMKFSDSLSIQSQNGNTDLYWFQLDPEGHPIKAFAFGGTDAEILTDLTFREDVLWLCGNFQGAFEIDDQRLETGLGVGSFLLKLNGDTGKALEAEMLSASVAAFIYQIDFANDGGVLAAGSFGGQLAINGQVFDAGPFYFGFVTDFDQLSTSINPTEYFSFKIYPNPFEDQVLIESPKTIKKIMLYDIMGRLRWSTQYPEGQLSLSFIENGLYQIIVQATDGSIARQWLLKR